MSDYLTFRYHRLWRRWRRRWQRALVGIERYVERYIWGRWHQLRLVRRFVSGWLLVLVISTVAILWQIHRLSESSLVLQPIPGGTYIEGEIGTASILNPVLPESSVSADVNSLVFDGLTKWGPDRQLEPDLATSWTVSSDGRTYTFHLRHGVKWQDGVPFDAQDVLFTLTAIQNPDSRSPLASSWQGVQATAPDNYTVVFTLPNSYPPFLDSTTVGIVPRHLLEDVNPQDLRTAAFDAHPVGTGPFEYESFDTTAGVVLLKANPNYFGGRPKLDQFEFRFYSTAQDAVAAYAQHQVSAISQITPDIVTAASQEPNLQFDDYALPDETLLFFNLTNSLGGDHALRQALAEATDRSSLIAVSEPNLAIPATQPLLPGQPGYTTQFRQDNYSLAAAKAGLTADGWVLGKDGWRSKSGHRLTLTVVTLQGSALQTMAQALAAQWRQLGVQLKVTAVSSDDLQQTYIRPRNFQLLLYGIEIGADPDVYAYWHSSQATDPGLNLSQYKSNIADQVLESARLTSDTAERAAKYQIFLKTWDSDQPAIVLATPIYRYGVAAAADGPAGSRIVEPSDRFANVVDWTILRRAVRH